MNLRIFEVSGHSSAVNERVGGHWMRFGDTVAMVGADVQRVALGGQARDTALFHDIRSEDLAVVIQKGRLFQKEHPEVPVLLDKGRYLLVQLAEDQAREISEHDDEPCFTIRPWEPGTEVFAKASPAAQRSGSPAWVRDLVDQVSESLFRPAIEHLVGLRTRHSVRPEYTDAAEWAKLQLENAGYDVSLQAIDVGGRPGSNVVADKKGSDGAAGVVYVVAHLDSVNSLGGEAADAPGADDNASGSAGALTIAHILADHSARHDLRIVLFGGEEQGLFGSTQHVAGLASAERRRILSVLNMDMIGSLNNIQPTVLLEGKPISRSMIDELAASAAAHTSLQVQTSLQAYASDHVPFLLADIPAVLTIEGADDANSAIHTAADTLDRINFDLAVEILRMNVGYVAQKLGQATVADGGARHCPAARSSQPLSGRYRYLGPIDTSGGRHQATPFRGSVQDRDDARRRRWAENSVYDLAEPLYTADRRDVATARQSVEITLHIDIDGTDPLGVVSGTIQQGVLLSGQHPLHFIGRVTSDTTSGSDRTLVVKDFRLDWVDGVHVVDQVDVTIDSTGSPTAAVTFTDTTRGSSVGPFQLPRESTFFRDVEFDYDREDGAIDVRSYDTHRHPDRPADLPHETITLESAFARAGINISLAPGSGTIVDTVEAGANERWNYQELHDSMSDHWDSFHNRPQWKMWLFAAKLADSDTLGGVMFDADIAEPGGVDRQGTALFTKCPHFHTEQGEYIEENPPTAEAVERELFFNLIHEAGHAFNLAHSFQKGSGEPWDAPRWMPIRTDDNALSWMNYPDLPSPGYNASWFYNRFRFRFDDNENLFLRHAPERFVQMGNEAWLENHGRVSRASLDSRLELQIRTLTHDLRMGQPLNVEFRLRNRSDQALMIHDELDLPGGFLEVAITDPSGVRRPFLPVSRSRCHPRPAVLQPNERMYHATSLVMGQLGWPFKTPGAYRIEAAFHNLDGSTAAAMLQVYVRPPSDYEELRVASELFNARVGRAISFGGTRVMEDVNDRLDDAIRRLPERHPSLPALTAARFMPLSRDQKLLKAGADAVEVQQADHDQIAREMRSVVERGVEAVNSLGHIRYEQVIDRFTESSVAVREFTAARHAQEQMLEVFRDRGVIEPVLSRVENTMRQLPGGAAAAPVARKKKAAGGSAAKKKKASKKKATKRKTAGKKTAKKKARGKTAAKKKNGKRGG